MNLVLLGPPGAGKGTQAEVLSNRLSIPHISTGDMLRDALRESKEIGKRAKEYMSRGELVPDELVIEIMKNRLERPDTESGFILDGYPRTETQAESLDRTLKKIKRELDLVLYFRTASEVSIKRLSGRRICSECNANYHSVNRKPKKDGICDKCGSGLYQRDDDKAETVKNRLRVYEDKTKSLIGYYKIKSVLRDVPGDYEAEKLYGHLIDLFKKEQLL